MSDKFQSQRKHQRIQFSPLSRSCTLVCITPQSPTAQVANLTLSPPEYEPDRSVSPTLIMPDVRATDPDGIFPAGSVNQYLSTDSIAWYVDDVEISKVWKAGTDYDIITTEGDERGMLKVYKNLSANTKAVLRFKGTFLDWRTNIPVPVESDTMPLTCTERGADSYGCSVDKPVIVYDPLYDNLLLYDYKVARGINVGGASRASMEDGKTFEQTVTVNLTLGHKQLSSLPSGVSMRLVKLGTSSAITANSDDYPQVKSISFPQIVFDMRMIAKEDYEVQIVKGSAILCRCTIGLSTNLTMPTYGAPMFGADLVPSMDLYENSLLLKTRDRSIECPELYYMIQWKTQAQVYVGSAWQYGEEKKWQRGEHLSAPVSQLGVGNTFNNSFFDVFFDVEPHEPCKIVSDENGNVLLDESGNRLID